MCFCMIRAPVCHIQTAGRIATITRHQSSGPARAMTVHGPKRLDEVSRGDVLETLAFGSTALEWIGSTVLSRHVILDMPYLAPIRITSNALAPGLPTSDLLVTQQQRLFVNSDLAGEYFGSYEALVPAVDLLRIPGVIIV